MPSTNLSKAKRKKTEPDFQCAYCKKEFVTETSLIKHICVKKEREFEKNEKHVRFALQVYRRFYEINQRVDRTWDQFRDSKYYNSFIKVGRYIVDANPINLSIFIDFLVKSGRPISEWTSPAMQEVYIRETVKTETPCAAIERNILLMQQWATATGNHWTDFFKKVSPVQATLWITTGRISPWVLYICETAEELIMRMSPEQLRMIETTVDPTFWQLRMDKYQEDVKFLRETFKEAGL